MYRFARALLTVALLALAAAPGASAAGEGDGPVDGPAVTYSPDRVIVEWARGASPAERRAARVEADVDFTRDLGNRRFQLVETEPGQTPREAVRELEADPAVILAERDAYDTPDAIPNDPLFDQLWGLRNTGVGVGGVSGALAGADIGAISAWSRTLGTPSTTVAVIDSGYRFEHPDLADVVWTNPGETENGLDDDGNGVVDDLHGADFVGDDASAPTVDGDPTDDDLLEGGHGVHTAGTIGAEGDNGIGITGVAQDVRLMPLRVCGRVPGGEGGCPHSAEIAAINYAGAHGARVANISLGGETKNLALRNALAANPQTLYVVSGGNETSNNDVAPRYPCNYDPLGEGVGTVDNVVCVAATDQADKLAWFSDWGAKSVDLAAPGTEVLSTFPYGYPIEDDFEVNDFAAKWDATGPDGGFARTAEAPLTSFGISDSPGGPPAADSVVESTSVPVSLSPGYEECNLELTTRVSGSSLLWVEVELDGELVLGIGTTREETYELSLIDRLGAGGELTLHLRYEAAAAPGPNEGAWVDDIGVRCIAQVGEADEYAFLQGTSMATPHVTGAAALLFSLKPSASVTEVRKALLGSVDRIPTLAGKTVSGGRLDAAAALDLFDALPPPAPVLSTTVPASPSDEDQPRLVGSAQRGTSVDVYANATCTGTPIASGPAAQLAGQGIVVSVAANATTELSAAAVDLAPHTSACSGPISYKHGKPTPDPGEGEGEPIPPPAEEPATPPAAPPPPPAPTCVVPKLAGKTLARAKAALKAAACRLGKVRKPKPRKGKRSPLVVKASTPRAGARPTSGKVDLTLGRKPRRG